MSIAGSARQASRSVLQRSPPLFSASAASFSRLRPSNTGSGIRRSPFLSGSPPSGGRSSSARKCCVVPKRPVAPSMTTPILRVAIQYLQKVDAIGPGEGRDPLFSRSRPGCMGPCLRRAPVPLFHRGGDRLAQDLRDLVEDLVRRRERRAEADRIARRGFGAAWTRAHQQPAPHRLAPYLGADAEQ